MKNSLKISRGLQLVGAILLVMGVVSCSNRSDPSGMAWQFIGGLTLIIGARTFEWFKKE
jgi:hypothetical protein